MGKDGDGWLSIECCFEGESMDGRGLELLSGLEKLNDGLANRGAPADRSELIDGDRGNAGTKGDSGECGADTPLLPESFLGCENVEPAFELV